MIHDAAPRAARHRPDRAAHRPVPVDARPSVLEAVSIMRREIHGRPVFITLRTRTTTTRPGQLPDRSASGPRRSAATTRARSFTVGIGGPVGSGKTALLLALCRKLRDTLSARRRHERHLHERRRRVPDAPRGAARRAHPRRRNGRLPAHGDSRRHQPEPRRARRA